MRHKARRAPQLKWRCSQLREKATKNTHTHAEGVKKWFKWVSNANRLRLLHQHLLRYTLCSHFYKNPKKSVFWAFSLTTKSMTWCDTLFHHTTTATLTRRVKDINICSNINICRAFPAFKSSSHSWRWIECSSVLVIFLLLRAVTEKMSRENVMSCFGRRKNKRVGLGSQAASGLQDYKTCMMRLIKLNGLMA